MANEILKTIKIDVNSSEYKALQQSLGKISELEKKINKLNEETNEQFKLRKNILENQINKYKTLTDEELKKLKISRDEAKLKAKELERDLKILDLNKKLIKEKKELVKLEREAKLQEAKDRYSNNIANFARGQQRAKWERGKESPLALAQRYKGAGGVFNFLSDQAERKGEAEVEGYDKQINEYEEKKKLNEAEMEKYQGELDDPNTKLSEKEIAERQQKIADLKKSNENIDSDIDTAKDKRSQSIGNTKTQMNKYAAMAQAAEKVAGQLKKVASTLLKPFKDLASAIMSTVKEMLDFKSGVATYNTQGSLITNSTAREQQMKYGLTSSQNYAFTQAKSMLNIQSDEDLMYMNSEQRDKFLGYMERYSAWYDQLESSGVLADIQEMQLEFNEFKQEIAMEFLQWVAENKETIMGCIKGIFNFVKSIANFVLGIVRVLTGGRYNAENIADSSDSYDSNTTNNNQRSTVINVNANTTNNATGVLSSQEALDAYNKENFNKLAKQLVTAIGG